MPAATYRDSSQLPAGLGFLAGGGEATRLILARDWTDHPLGLPQDWPSGLKTALSLVLNSPESMILCWDPDDLHFFFNETYFPLLGPRLDWAMGARFDQVWADALDQAMPIVRNAFAGESQHFDDLPWKLATDRGAADTWWSFSYSRILDADGGLAGLFIFTNETTKRVLADRALVDSQDELRALNENLERRIDERTAERDRMWNSSPDLMVVLSPEGEYREVNPAWAELLGYTTEDLVGHGAVSLTHPDDLAATEAALATAQVGTLPSFENRFRHKDGSYRWIQWVAAPGPHEIFAIGRHITANKEAEERLRLAEEQLRQSQKMEAVGQLTGGIAHDFNNMLTGVIGSLDLLKRYLSEGRTDRIERYIDGATTSAQRAAGLTQRLLAFSRRQSLDVKPVDIARTIADMEDMLRRTLGDVRLEIRLHAGGWNAMTDANQLESALLNLAINARDAMPDGGMLTIETDNVSQDTTSDEGFDPMEAGDYVMIAVSDTGTGMTPDVIAKAFDPFFTTKPIGQGTGLGLSMIYGFVRQVGGNVRIYSHVGRGTTVKLFLKRHASAVEVGRESTLASPMPGGRGERILMVEDEPAVRMLIVDVLEDLGYNVRVANDGVQALSLLEQDSGVDLLVTDVGLPGLNGRQLAELARQRVPGLRTLFVTGYAEKAAIRSGFLDEGMDMITKPFAIDTLAGKIREMLSQAI